jgi:fido (protein-threonine AMPylation protein)
MRDDLPIYPDTVMLRTGVQFADLLRWKGMDISPVHEKADERIAGMEGASSIQEARAALAEPGKAGLLRAHSILFEGRAGAGRLRSTIVAARFRSQDCVEPPFIDRSLDNFFSWMGAESMAEIHPIERAAIVLTRVIDIWPFDFGNFTAALVLANAYLNQAGLPPFYVLPEHFTEFEKIVAQAVSIETHPLVNAIHATIKREYENLAGR